MKKQKLGKVEDQNFTRINGFLLCNNDKLDRVVNGSVGPGGRMSGGLGKEASPEAILAAYDRLGGLILDEDGEKVATGSFWDFVNKVAVTNVKKAPEPNTKGIKLTEENVGDDLKPRKKKAKKDEE